MKTIAILKVSLLTICLGSILQNDSSFSVDEGFSNDSLLSCFWVTYCGDPDNYSPVAQPEDKKTDTKDTKDIKLA